MLPEKHELLANDKGVWLVKGFHTVSEAYTESEAEAKILADGLRGQGFEAEIIHIFDLFPIQLLLPTISISPNESDKQSGGAPTRP